MLLMLNRFVLSVALAGAPTQDNASTPKTDASSGCPDGGKWYGHAPPHGFVYYCGIEQNGELVKHGWSVSYHPSGKIAEACEYRNGKLDGRCSKYDVDGSLRTRGTHRAGVPVGFQWFWGVRLGEAAEPQKRRVILEDVFTEFQLGADIPVLAQHVLDHCDSALDDIRNAPQVCTPALCVSAATIDDKIVIALQYEPPAEKVEAGAAAYRVAQARAAEQKAAEEKAAKLRRKQYEKALKSFKKKQRAWDYTHLRCNDGTRSPSCICGGSYQGCCSHHGGVSGCPRDLPQEPMPPED
jgi:hypothetical protein